MYKKFFKLMGIGMAVLLVFFSLPIDVFATGNVSDDGLVYSCSDSEGIVYISGHTGNGENITIPSKGTARIVGYTGNGGNITIPSTYDGYNVLSVAYNAFKSNDNITSVVISEDVALGDSAFVGCKKLASVEILYGITEISPYAFSYCKSLTSVTIPDSVTVISSYAFEGCNSLASITLPDSIGKIYSEAFSYCENLTSIDFPDSIEVIGQGAFHACRSLTEVVIPDSITIINKDVFLGCINLTSVTIPNSVTEIGDYAFKECTSLTSITIPDSVTAIGHNAFEVYASGGNDIITIHCTSGSYAEQYAIENNLNYVIEENPAAGILTEEASGAVAEADSALPMEEAASYENEGDTAGDGLNAENGISIGSGVDIADSSAGGSTGKTMAMVIAIVGAGIILLMIVRSRKHR